MSCDIANGRNVSCKDATGGIKGIYFVNFKALLIDDASVSSNTITAFASDEDAGLTAFHYQTRREMASLSINVNSSPENGTTFFEQRVSMTFNKLSQAEADRIKILAYGRPHIIVEDNQDNLILLGAKNGMDLSSGQMESGRGFGDRNGFSLEFTGREDDPFYTLVGAAGPESPAAAPFELFEAADITIHTNT